MAAVDTWWKARRDADPKGALADAAAIARRTRILPDAACQQILDGLTYGTPEKQAEAAKALDALDQDAPAVADTLPLAARTCADVIGRALAQGRDPEAAAAIAEQLLGPATGLTKDAARVTPMGLVTLLAGTGGEGTAYSEDDDQLAMGSVRGVYNLVRPRIEGIGRYLRKRLRGWEREERSAESPIPPDRVIDTIHRRLRESGKRKVELEAQDFGSEVEPTHALEAFVDAALTREVLPNRNFEAQLNLPPVSEGLVERVRTETGLDLEGYRRAIDVGHIRHVMSRHGEDGEEAQDQEPIDREALALYLDIVESPDKVSVRTRRNQPSRLRSEKRVNGWAVVVEETRTRAKTLSFVTMWVKKAE